MLLLLFFFSVVFHCLFLHMCLRFIVMLGALDMLLIKPTYLLTYSLITLWHRPLTQPVLLARVNLLVRAGRHTDFTYLLTYWIWRRGHSFPNSDGTLWNSLPPTMSQFCTLLKTAMKHYHGASVTD